MLFALWLACAGPESAEDLEELLDRTEALEREVAIDAALDRIEALEVQVRALQLASGADEVDADGDGLRDRDRLPLGSRRGDVLFDIACPENGEGVTFPDWFQDMPLVPPRWEVWNNNAADGSGRWIREPAWIAGGEADYCTGLDQRWVAIAW